MTLVGEIKTGEKMGLPELLVLLVIAAVILVPIGIAITIVLILGRKKKTPVDNKDKPNT
ncbi:MAG: hypothetical protein AB1599_03570 [Planctomycetota bacterium]